MRKRQQASRAEPSGHARISLVRSARVGARLEPEMSCRCISGIFANRRLRHWREDCGSGWHLRLPNLVRSGQTARGLGGRPHPGPPLLGHNSTQYDCCRYKHGDGVEGPSRNAAMRQARTRPFFSEICGGLCGFLQTLLHEPKRHLSPGNRFEDPGMRTDLRGVSGSSPRRSLLQVHSLLLPLR